MGNQHSGEHGHSHNGQPCHGHGPAAQQHGHSHGAQQQHGHSHGAQQHGHSHGAQAPAHGHSHGGKPCHGHGPAAQPQQHGHSHGAQQQHGHSHGAQQHGPSHGAQAHGHSHGGKPCHGHGPGAGAAPQPTTPEQVELMKKQKGVQLFVTQMFTPKIPITWAHFHQNSKRDAKKETTSSGLKVPHVDGENMNRAEFREFIEAFLTAQARYDGHTTVRVVEAMQMERQILNQFGFKEAFNDPEVEIKFPYEKFKGLITQLVMITAMRKYDSMQFLMAEMGLGAMKLPNLPQLSIEIEPQRIRGYSREKVMPLLIQFVEANAEANAKDQNSAVASGFVACTASIRKGIDDYINHIKQTKLTKAEEAEPPSAEEMEKRWTEYVAENIESEGHVAAINEEVGNLESQAIAHPAEVLGELKIHPHSEEFAPELVANQVQQLVVIPLLEQNPLALQFIAKQWSIDLLLQEITEEDGVVVPPQEKKD